MGVSKYGNIRSMERKVRASLSYARWVERNRAAVCFKCGATSDLECHHIVELYTIVASLSKFYGDDEKRILEHAVAMHDNDSCENVTLCGKCHAQKHPGRQAQQFKVPTRKENWTVYPRNIKPPLSQSTTTKTESSLGLVGLQVLLSLGWYVLNGYVESRMLTVNRRRLADMLGKTPGTSFNRSLDDTLRVLLKLGVLIGSHRKGNQVEMHLAPDYLSSLDGNPWFMSLDDLRTSSTCVLTLRWFLGTQGGKRTYRIGLDKLKTHLGMTVRDDWMAGAAVRKACAQVQGVKLELKKGMCTFSFPKKGAVPIYSLRATLHDSVEAAR